MKSQNHSSNGTASSYGYFEHYKRICGLIWRFTSNKRSFSKFICSNSRKNRSKPKKRTKKGKKKGKEGKKPPLTLPGTSLQTKSKSFPRKMCRKKGPHQNTRGKMPVSQSPKQNLYHSTLLNQKEWKQILPKRILGSCLPPRVMLSLFNL